MEGFLEMPTLEKQQKFIFHDKNQVFKIICSMNDDDKECVREEDTFTVDAQVYISKCRVYFGHGKKWYTFRAKDISNVKSHIPARKLSIEGDSFNVELSCDDPRLLNMMRDLLFLCRYVAPS